MALLTAGLLGVGMSPGVTEEPPVPTSEEIRIESLEDFKAILEPSRLQESLMQVEAWLPQLVNSVEWETRLGEHLILHYAIDKSDENDSLFETLPQACDTMVGELIRFFEIVPSPGVEAEVSKTRLPVFVVKTESPMTFGMLPDPHILFYYLDPRQDPSYLVKFRHELSHWVWGRMYGEAPALFQEGLAFYAEHMSGPEAREDEFQDIPVDLEKVPPFEELIQSDVFFGRRGMYTAGGLWIHYLVDQHGWGPLKAFFRSTDQEDPDVGARFEEVYGMSLTEAESQWRAHMRSIAARPAP